MELGIGSRVKHSTLGEGVVCGLSQNHYRISFISKGVVEVLKNFPGLEVIELVEEELVEPTTSGGLSIEEVEDALQTILLKWSDATQIVKIAERWQNGTLIMKPSNDSQSKEIPLDQFFHKIVMLRDRLRVMEQKINAHPKLSDADKVDMQQYITRIYGSLTTFNVLFKLKDDQFVGAKGEN